MLSRLDRSPVATWWWTVDRWFLAAFLALMTLGIVLSFAASPAVADRIGLPPYHFVTRQIVFMLPALAVMIIVSFLDAKGVRRLAFATLALAMILMVVALLFGAEVKGSRRWVNLVGISIQPSEFLKPAFVIVCAWLFSEHKRHPEIPGNLFSMLLVGAVVALLIMQPDFGQTILVTATWGAMFFMAGMAWFWIILFGGVGLVGGFAAYTLLPHVAGRIDRFMTGEGDTYQVDLGREAIIRGGWLGQGPGEGTVKRILPDSHTDFVFSVAAEEFGIILCMGLMLIFAFIVMRGLRIALKEHDDFTRFAVGGLVIQLGLQSMINMSVNLQLMPAKGMTLPLISYGGSSLIAVAISAGMILALTRTRPERLHKPGFGTFSGNAVPVG
ncbi:MAG: putative lipid II flippase FtsW [Methylobacterium mesophilicum]|nr:putative lipid II flippase FtsW [Methylobacterium mesophilicum]